MSSKYWYVLFRSTSNLLTVHSLRTIRSDVCMRPWKYSSIRQCSSVPEQPDVFQYDIASVSVDVEAVAGDEPSKIKAVRALALEMDLLRQTGCNYIPQKLTVSQWHDLLDLKCKDDRLNFYKIVCIEEAKENLTIPFEDLSETDCSKSLFPQVSNHQIERLYDYKLSLAQIFGPHLLVDCSHECSAKPHELTICAAELSRMLILNRQAENPFNIIFCNIDSRNSKLITKLAGKIPSLCDNTSFVNFTEMSYLNLFPATQLVYLTPFSKNELGKFDGNLVYIMGTFLDHSPETSSLAISKSQGIRTAKFPIDKFLKWKGNTKTLPLDQCIAILNDVKNGTSWQYAFRHIPREKLKNIDEEFTQKQRIKKPVKPRRYLTVSNSQNWD